MLWKDSYKLGVSSIDKQHYKLFFYIENLIMTLKKTSTDGYRKECMKTIAFLKEYVVFHFNDEEKYQKKIGYISYNEHKKIHENLTNSVLEYENMFNESNYDPAIVKDFCGMLLAWLIHHVADCDTRVAKREALNVDKAEDIEDGVKKSVVYILNEMFAISDCEIKSTIYKVSTIGRVHSTVEINGTTHALITFSCTEETAMEMVKNITGIDIKCVDELVISAMGEIAGIISSRLIGAISKDDERYTITSPITEVGTYKSNDNIIYAKISAMIYATSLGKIEVLVRYII